MAGTGIVKRAHMRSVSEPALRVSCGSYSRERTRLTDLAYERGKDNVAHWIGAWSFEEVGCFSLFRGYNSVWAYTGVIMCAVPFSRYVRFFSLLLQDAPSTNWSTCGL